MLKRIMLLGFAFAIGYATGTENLPKGLETLLFAAFAYISGLFQMKVFINFWSKRKDVAFRIFGYEVRKVKASLKLVGKNEKECELCHGNEVRLNKQKIPCPKCKSVV